MYIAVTLALGMRVPRHQGVEYKAKFEHGILPGHIGDHLENTDVGYQYKDKIRGQLKSVIDEPGQAAHRKDSATYKEVESALQAARRRRSRSGDQRSRPTGR